MLGQIMNEHRKRKASKEMVRKLFLRKTGWDPNEEEETRNRLNSPSIQQGSCRGLIWLLSDNMHHQWLLLAACFWVIFMFMVASKFITLTFKDPDEYGAKQEPLMLTAMTKVEKVQVPEEKRLPEEFQPTGKALSGNLMHQPLIHMERLELLQNVCRDVALRNLSHTTVSKFILDRIFVCDKHKILFCQTPKVGNTQWKKVLIVLNGAFSSIEEIPENIVHDHEKNGLPRLSSFSDSEIQKRLNLYFKFFIVRDPFERLISAFKDKFVHNPRFEPWYRHEIAPGIIRKYRKNRTETRGLQFEDFVRYLGDPNHRWLDVQFGDHIIHWVTTLPFSSDHPKEGGFALDASSNENLQLISLTPAVNGRRKPKQHLKIQ
ncbi:carbohydrate sulfotransferase 10 isoform C [Alligator mississippiensis]|uniref:Carbohydrate sulfotransferase n=1 Tax=Alligator mississippiensis TaxID=8496 RepID=A0A151NWZ7_ALLMI|nr:carbohydrate sulfotransferase 10 isoform C [Alligator mississippiensis]